MEYTKTYKELKNLFSQDKEEISIPGSGVKIRNTIFNSEFKQKGFLNNTDRHITENQSFSYPVFTPVNTESTKVILLLHGLNERSWVKCLAWAYYLAVNTDSYVVLFPISFHINRSPATWKDPRAMVSILKQRNSSIGEIQMSSFANVALSNRLTEDPMRFFNSGYQTTQDITKLISGIRDGTHPFIPATTKIDIFSYSIGAFLAEIIMMGNPDNLFTSTKLFIFCGGSVFSNMQGTSRLIMDSRAFERIYSYYLNDFEEKISIKNPVTDFLRSSQIGMAFRSMIDLGRFKSFRESTLKNLRHRIYSISLLKDAVIPANGIVATLRHPDRKNMVDIWDFPYDYTHENPFPLFDSRLSDEVDRCFENLFLSAKAFLA
jgi:hypothetical protein